MFISLEYSTKFDVFHLAFNISIMVCGYIGYDFLFLLLLCV